MKVLIYAVLDDRVQASLEAIRTHVTVPQHFVSSHAVFQTALAECFSGETIVVFFVHDADELAYLETMESKLLDTKLVLNLGTTENRLLLHAYKLHPRFISLPHDPPDLLAMTINGIVREMNRTRFPKKALGAAASNKRNR